MPTQYVIRISCHTFSLHTNILLLYQSSITTSYTLPHMNSQRRGEKSERALEKKAVPRRSRTRSFICQTSTVEHTLLKTGRVQAMNQDVHKPVANSRHKNAQGRQAVHAESRCFTCDCVGVTVLREVCNFSLSGIKS